MALLDPSIYGQIQGPRPDNRLAQYAQMMAIQNAQSQNRLAELSFGQQQEDRSRGREGEAMLSRLIAEGGDVAGGLARGGYGTKSLSFTKQQQDALKVKGDIAKTVGEVSKQKSDLIDQSLKQSRAFLDTVTTPEAYLQWHKANHADAVLGPVFAARGVTEQSAMASINEALGKPGGFEELLNKSRVGIEKFTEMNKPQFVQQDSGGALRTLAIPGMGGTASPVAGSTIPRVQTPESVAAAATALAGQQSVAETARLARVQSADQFKITQADKKEGKPISRVDALSIDKSMNIASGSNAALQLLDNAAALYGNYTSGLGEVILGPMGRAGAVVRLGDKQRVIDYELAGQIAKDLGVIKLGLIGGSDTERELRVAIDTSPSPDKLPKTNMIIIANQRRAIEILQAEPDFKTEWVNRHGSLSSLDKATGGTYGKAWRKFQTDNFKPATAGDVSASRTSGGTVGAPLPSAAVKALLAGAGTDAQFDQQFGPGSAARARGR